uniref:hypothetical protein n=1 Tax=Candidatus Electronema sp. TaxID=2698783 RepID=UPI004056C6D3
MTADNAETRTAAPKKNAALDKRCGQTAVTVFLLAVFGLVLLCVGIGLTWLAPVR